MPFKTELHAHCSEVSPCADMSAEQVVDCYLEAGYTTLVLTNHFITRILNEAAPTWDEQIDFFLRPLELMRRRAAGRMHILLGAELRFDDHQNDYLLFGFDEEFLRTHPHFLSMKLMDFHELCRENGFLLIQAHPFRNGMKITRPDQIDGVEVFNGHPGHAARNDIALAWAKKYDLIPTSGSDFHHPRPRSLETGGILTEEPVVSMEQLVTILRERQATLLCSGPAAERDGMTDIPARF